MSDNKHRGPWLLRAHDNFMDGDDVQPLEIIDCDGEVIACNTSYYPTELDEKYAHLIAAAPEIYEALEDVLNSKEIVNDDPLVNKIIAALAKAGVK